MITSIHHYTIESGHVRHSPRSEVDDEIINALRPMLSPGTHNMPGTGGAYTVLTTIEGGALAATVYHRSAPLVTTLVCTDSESLTDALRITGAKPNPPLSAPCLLVEVHPTIAIGPGAAQWLGDFERCLAWAWIEHKDDK